MEKLDLILQKMDVMQSGIDELKADVVGLKTDVAGLKTDVADLRSGLKETNTRLQKHEEHVENELRDLKLQLENEVMFGIRAVADRHFDLGRKLDDVIDQRYHKEQLYVRMLHLSTQIDKIKRNCRHCA